MVRTLLPWLAAAALLVAHPFAAAGDAAESPDAEDQQRLLDEAVKALAGEQETVASVRQTAAFQQTLTIAPPGGDGSILAFHPLADGGLVIATGVNERYGEQSIAGAVASLLGFGSTMPGPAYPKLAPDMHTPVTGGDRILGIVKGKVHCVAARDLAPVWTKFDRSLAGHVSLIASADRDLAFTEKGELVLIDPRGAEIRILDRLQVLPPGQSTYAHPAIAGERMFVRGPRGLTCLALRGP